MNGRSWWGGWWRHLLLTPSVRYNVTHCLAKRQLYPVVHYDNPSFINFSCFCQKCLINHKPIKKRHKYYSTPFRWVNIKRSAFLFILFIVRKIFIILTTRKLEIFNISTRSLLKILSGMFWTLTKASANTQLTFTAPRRILSHTSIPLAHNVLLY